MTARAHVMTLAGFTLAGLFLIAAMGLIVDGFGLFGTRLISAAHFPPNVRLMKHWDRVTKAIEMAERHGDKILIVGDSRSQHGLDPDAPALGGVQGYNGSLAAASLAEQLVALDYALKHEPSIKRVVWGQSFESFPFEIFEPTDFRESAFAGRPILPGLVLHLFGADRVLSNFKALLQSRRTVRAPMKRNGVVTYPGDPPEGPSVARQYEAELTGKYRELQGPLPQDLIDKAHAELAAKLRELKAAGIDVDIVIVPIYIWRLEFLRQIGDEAQSDAWKRQFVATLAALADAPGTGKLRLFDFARPHHLVEQSPYVPPPPGERRYYLETNHFYPWLGDKVLAKVFGREEDEATDDAFGREIGHGSNSISIDEDIATAKAALDQWEGSHPDDVNLVKRIVSH